MRLSEIKPGQRAVIDEVTPGMSSLRLMELGFIPGSQVELQAVAPTGDPIAVLVDHSLISLRKSDANAVLVTLLHQVAN
jgi:ferrous iron transport protein A